MGHTVAGFADLLQLLFIEYEGLVERVGGQQQAADFH